MTNGQRTVTSLLAVVAVLLGINLIVNLPPEAVAQDQFEFEFEAARTPHVIQVETATAGRVYRLWSDGVIEVAQFEGMNTVTCLPSGGLAWQEIAETVPLPPGVRITRIYTWGHFPDILLRLRSDGVVEQNIRSVTLGWCGWRTPPE